MDRIVLDESSTAKLSQLAGSAEVCDEMGRVIGHFRPLVEVALYRDADPGISEDELDRREQDPVLYTTPEVLARLKAL
jgi:hypothetical protein